MHFIADFHIHSHYARATSRDLTFPNLYRSALMKGVQVVGTGDFTHPGWVAEMEEFLQPAPEGLYRLKAEYADAVEVPSLCQGRERKPAGPVRFLLSAEISTIYKKNGRTRKVHSVVFAPDIESAKKVNERLSRIGNLASDGRPILGLDTKDLLEILLSIAPDIHLIPAHIWTPWFSVLGANSGFDHIEECFEELTEHIFALETGLSSDPAMNWLCSRLDRFALVSNSDAHSPGKLGREANLFDTDLSYPGIFGALKSCDPKEFLGTIEFYPEEGKYHLDGHRKCGTRLTPEETVRHRGMCPVCGKPVTVGVMHRVFELADRKPGTEPPKARPFQTLVALGSIIGEVLKTGPDSKKVRERYWKLLERFGPEIEILRNLPLSELEDDPLLAEAIRRVREGRLTIAAGYDGEFGQVQIFGEGERETVSAQNTFFFLEQRALERGQVDREAQGKIVREQIPSASVPAPKLPAALNAEQKEAVGHRHTPLLIVAGPGTGKTHTLTERIARLVRDGMESVLGLTFTNKAAREMRERLSAALGEAAQKLTISTFHRLGLTLLRRYGKELGLPENFAIYEPEEVWDSAQRDFPQEMLAAISQAKGALAVENLAGDLAKAYLRYQDTLAGMGGVDIDDLVALPVKLLKSCPHALEECRDRFRAIAVDEYQDINRAQYELVKLLAAGGADLCVIGDPDQAIYGFRGSDVRYFLRFAEDFPNARHIRLSQNYRSCATILDSALAVIAHNRSRIPGTLTARISGGEKVRIFEAPSEKAEAEFIVQTIEEILGGITHFSLDSERASPRKRTLYSFGSFAVLYRIHSQAVALEEAMARSGIPYHITGPVRSAALRKWQCLLRVLENPCRDLDLIHILEDLPAVGTGAIAKIRECAGYGPIYHVVKSGRLPVSKAARESIATLVRDLDLWRDPANRDMSAVLDIIQKSRPYWVLDDESRTALCRAGSAADLILTRSAEEPDFPVEKVCLMTLHAAKGLEFPVVFITGCEDGLMPYRDSDPEEERRLFYVGLTRAEEMLYLLRSRKRAILGGNCAPSPYLAEIPTDFSRVVRSDWKKKSRGKARGQLDFFAGD